jgi:hypothetical protein
VNDSSGWLLRWAAPPLRGVYFNSRWSDPSIPMVRKIGKIGDDIREGWFQGVCRQFWIWTSSSPIPCEVDGSRIQWHNYDRFSSLVTMMWCTQLQKNPFLNVCTSSFLHRTSRNSLGSCHACGHCWGGWWPLCMWGARGAAVPLTGFYGTCRLAQELV